MASTKQLLVTGFGPFGHVRRNSSWDLAQGVDGLRVGNVRVVARLIKPVVFDRSADLLRELLRRIEPDAVLSFGVAPSRTPRLERYAHNLRDAAVPDNDGVQENDGRRIDPSWPEALRNTLPLEAIRDRLRAAGHRLTISNSAGGYVCNDVYFALLQWQQQNGRPAAFVHWPNMELADGRRRRDITWERLVATRDALVEAVAATLAEEAR
ncbi:MAG: pyroglutamyl-peptidase I [Candidatus Lernaella stagnicola]|nr:pyroglutamyl-peptidase I [Candidatus Lernaella stagnicola]